MLLLTTPFFFTRTWPGALHAYPDKSRDVLTKLQKGKNKVKHENDNIDNKHSGNHSIMRMYIKHVGIIGERGKKERKDIKGNILL